MDLGTCEAQFAARPLREEASRCFYGLALKQGPGSPEARRFEAIQRRHPDNPWAALYLGHLKYQELDRARELYRAAADAFAARREALGELTALSGLHRVLSRQGRLAEAGREVARAATVAGRSGDPSLVAMGRILEARHLVALGEDFERAYVLLRRAQATLFPDGRYFLQRDCLLALANVSFYTGRIAEARASYRRLAGLASAKKDHFSRATALHGLANSLLEEITELPRAGGREQVLELARQALAAAEASGNREVEVNASWILGRLSQGEEARRHLDRCLAAAAAPRDQSYCLDALARHLAAADPRAARAAADRALELARQAEAPWAMAFAWRERMRVSWQGAPLERAVADSQAALDAIEVLRDLQTSSASQAGMFSTWTEDYYWLSGRLLETVLAAGGTAGLEQAFNVAERMRARTLIDALEAARAAPAAAPAAVPLRQRRAAVLEAISGVQRRLLDPGLPSAARAAASAELELLEIEEADLRDRLARTDPAFTSLRRPRFASLARLRRSLAADEALLSFQIAPWEDARGDFAGGSWLLVSTRAATRVYRLPGRSELRSAVRLFTGTFERRDGSEISPSVHLNRELLGQALRELPAGIGRLVLVPDDALHQLPFGALRPEPEAAPLAARYELSIVPSATLWLAWREHRPAAAAIPALALADPPPPGAPRPEEAAAERSAAFSSLLRLGSLPYARRESRAVVRALGGGSLRRLGEEASEGFLKRADLGRFALLHFATHAVLDEQKPERSGVLLAAAPGGDDGLLQIREIVDLDLDGRIVVLASCRSASGALLRGEGVMGLARAFFQAGSHSVVASLWPLRDDEAAALFGRFYDHLGRGMSLAAALQAAQRDRIADGAPAAAWAGLAVLGDGDLVPLPGGRKGLARKVAVGAVFALLLGAGAGFCWRKTRRSGRPAGVPPRRSTLTH